MILRVGLLNAASRLDPQDSFDLACVIAQRQLYEAPFDLRRRGAVPVLFEDDLQEEVPGRFRARLREDLVLSDGSPLDAAMVREALLRSRILAQRMTIRAQDDVLTFETETSAEDLAMELTKIWSMIAVPRGGRLLGTGPFMVADETDADCLRLVRNPYHRRHPPQVDELHFVPFPPGTDGLPTALVRALEQEDIDLACGLSREAVAPVRGVRRLVLRGNSTAFLWFNTDRISQRQVRRAIAMALDRESITALSYPNAGTMVARSLLPPRISKFDDGHRVDRRRAKEVLEAADLGRTLRLLVIWAPRPYMPHPRNWAQRIERDLARVGVGVDIHASQDPAHYQAVLKAGDYDMVLGGWNADTEDPADFVEALMWSGHVPRPGDTLTEGCNFSRWADDGTDELLARFRRERSMQALEDVLRLVHREMVAFPIACGEVVLVHGDAVQGLEADACGVPHLWNVDVDRTRP